MFSEQSQIFFYGIIIFYESIKTKTNLLKFFNIILYSVLKNYTIFSSHKGEYLIQDRIYYTCPIKNFIFKRMGGKKLLACKVIYRKDQLIYTMI